MVGEKPCTIYLVRHGESEANIKRIVNGHTNTKLTEAGREKARSLAETFRGLNFSAIYSSDLDRARETAEILRKNSDVEVQLSGSLREKFFGEFEGMEHAKYLDILKDEFYKFEHDLTQDEMWKFKAHPSMESDEEVFSRVSTFLKGAAASNLGKNILVISHRYAIRMFLIRSGYGKYKSLRDGALRPCGYAVVESDGVSIAVKEAVGAEIEKPS